MAKSEPTTQGASKTEFVVKCGKQGVFSHAKKAVCVAKIGSLSVADLNNGVDKEYALFERTVTYPDLEKFPVGDEGNGYASTVKEKEISYE